MTTFDLLLRVAFDWTAGWSHGGPFSIQTIFLKKKNYFPSQHAHRLLLVIEHK